ncbi:uracil-DNA glycosylase [Trichloromonas sp.]|uniref:uracil-DNA glycosylase n=1 Tax=Trichloromonas sp. TaxID=3069249 RepID=UPI002A45BE31|nr:uracil-DNA glycosylase [Trichloromonas sp.]
MDEAFVERVANCRRCPRLVDYLRTLPAKGGRTRQDYWNRPVPGFGDPQARVFLVGLAPGAHGANRTGRPFTGDGAGDFMYPLLYRAGFASCPEVSHAGDGLYLTDLYISNAVKCAPPENKPLPAEFAQCRPFLAAELGALPRLKVVLALGQGAFTSCLRLFKEEGLVARLADYPFGHGAAYPLTNGLTLVASYHSSRYNVQTGRINAAMFLDLLTRVREIAARENG